MNDDLVLYYEATSEWLARTGPVGVGDVEDRVKGNSTTLPPGRDTSHFSQYDHSAAPALHKGQNDFAQTEPIANPPSIATKDITDIKGSNIVIFGETGVGKSSVINLIAGQEVARTSNGALGCTFQHERHTITLDGVWCSIWDTTGLEEGSEGRVPAALAESNLKALIRGLAHAGGIHLVMYCIRAGRATRALQRNYHLFYVTVCRKKVPVALVVTGLEHQEGEMETWWHENEADLQRSGMWFDAHACVTTLGSEDQIIRSRQADSRNRLRELVFRYSSFTPWQIKSSFISWVLPTFRGALRRTFPGTRPGHTRTVRRVIICDMADEFRSSFQLAPGINAVWQRFDGLVGDTQYEFVRMDKRALHMPTSPSQNVTGVGAGVLVFYTSVVVDTGIPPKDVEALKTFYDVAGGEICPLIVVLRGCNDEAAARTLWGDVALLHADIHVAHLTFLPGTVDGQVGPQVELNDAIKRLCIEHVEAVPTGSSKADKRFLAAFVEGFVVRRAKQLAHIP